ncbi:DNA repair protein XRCC1 isoform X2 [Trichosurus vulpecula]|uniref:DNA repair protein XRCC1 isoform X2 n=1 Tax=Trichosurus vulpecula TaxID=9337 RepID=UPI00186B0348|nr:DNA repair protein XRCC1 isoform X2 [Trichosurus vulpecula]
MPEIRLRHVVSCSSQDPTHSADNLLKADTYRKWRSAKAGEKQISVILQLEKEEQIHSLDIGNEGSAFVEVLAGSSAGGSGDQDYEVLLVTSSFMSPSESRSGTNLNRVRLFAADKLVRATAEKRWDRIKIVCSQPYTKDSPYGLSFIRLHSPPDKEEPGSAASPVTKLGAFRVKEDDETSSSLRPGALFFSRVSKASPAPTKEQPGPSYAAATLQASQGLATQSPPRISPPQPPSSSRAPSKPQESPKGKRKLDLSHDEPGSSQRPQTHPAHPKLPVPKKPKVPAAGPSPAQGTPQTEKKGAKAGAGAGPGQLGKVLEGVVVVLSGFQNPFRSELRDKALELGAKYRPDWTSDSTHLICAFANTPKYSAVLSRGGRIVRKEWVLDCHRMRRRLPCQRYLMAGPDSSSDEETSPPTTKRPQANHQPPAAGPKSGPRTPSPEEPQPAPRGPQEDPYMEEELADAQDNGTEDSGDTEDELRRVVKLRDQKQLSDPGENGEDPYAGSTDENTDDEDPELPDQPIPELPDFFQGKRFFLYGEFPGEERRQLVRFVTAFSGEIEDYMNDRVQFVITAQEWDSSFEEALLENPSLAFVRPRWIYSCNEQQRLLPYQLYGVVPQA